MIVLLKYKQSSTTAASFINKKHEKKSTNTLKLIAGDWARGNLFLEL